MNTERPAPRRGSVHKARSPLPPIVPPLESDGFFRPRPLDPRPSEPRRLDPRRPAPQPLEHMARRAPSRQAPRPVSPPVAPPKPPPPDRRKAALGQSAVGAPALGESAVGKPVLGKSPVGDPVLRKRPVRRTGLGEPVKISSRPAIGVADPASQRRGAGRGRTGATQNRAPVQPDSRGGYVLLVAVIAALGVIGLAMVLSASSVQSVSQYGSPWYYFDRQILWLAIGTASFALAVRLDYHRLRKLSKLGMLICLICLVAVLVPGVGVDVSGSSRWLGSATLRIQPSEFAKLALVFFAADVLDRRAARIRKWTYALTPVLLVLIVLAVLVMSQPDMGTTMVLACIALGALYCAAAPMLPLMGLVASGFLVSVGLAVAAPYRFKRLLSFLHPLRDASNTGYQSAQGIEAIVTGRLFGVGLGASPASWGYLPNPQTDFIFAVAAQETGLFGSLLLVGLFGAFAVLGVRAACRAPDRFGALLAAGVTAWIVSQAIINIGAVVGLLPVTGVPLPFVSFGGSSLVFSMFAVGVLCSVAKRGIGPSILAPAEKPSGRANPDIRSGRTKVGLIDTGNIRSVERLSMPSEPPPPDSHRKVKARIPGARRTGIRIDRSQPIDRARKVYIDAGVLLRR